MDCQPAFWQLNKDSAYAIVDVTHFAHFNGVDRRALVCRISAIFEIFASDHFASRDVEGKLEGGDDGQVTRLESLCLRSTLARPA